MDVTTGWSTEFAKLRFGVTLEEPEFLALCVEHGLDSGKLLVREKFLVMYHESQVISATVKVTSGKWEGAKGEFDAAVATQNVYLAKVKTLQASR